MLEPGFKVVPTWTWTEIGFNLLLRSIKFQVIVDFQLQLKPQNTFNLRLMLNYWIWTWVPSSSNLNLNTTWLKLQFPTSTETSSSNLELGFYLNCNFILFVSPLVVDPREVIVILYHLSQSSVCWMYCRRAFPVRLFLRIFSRSSAQSIRCQQTPLLLDLLSNWLGIFEHLSPELHLRIIDPVSFRFLRVHVKRKLISILNGTFILHF